MARLIVGLTGFARCGKDTAATGLVECRGFTRLAFADLLKKVAYDTDPFVEAAPGTFRRLAELVDDVGLESAKDFPDVRRLLQRLGTEGGRNNLGGNVWVDPVMRSAAGSTNPVVITDVRFPNEAVAVRAAGGFVVRVTRPNVAAINTHSSDAGVASLSVDFDVSNDGNVKDLHDVMCGLADRLSTWVTSRRRRPARHL